MLLGRHGECHRVEQLLGEAKVGHSGALVVRGEAGIGKTALLEHLRTRAGELGFRIETSTGAEAETQFAYAGLHQLCAPLLDQMPALPEPQQLALRVALGRDAGSAPDRFLVGLATLGLLSEAAERNGLLCLVDDAQWLDQASTEVLAFVARRIGAERLAMVFGVRDDGTGGRVFAGLPELRLSGLGDTDARLLLDSVVPVPLDEEVRDRIIAEARGNPLALLELPSHTSPVRLAGGFQQPDLSDVSRRVQTEYQNRADGLPEESRMLLLVAAAEPTGDPTLLWRAAAHAGISPESAAPAESAGLIEIGTRVRFRHPLARSAVYRAAGQADRRRAHAALAAVTDPASEPDRRAWHAAQATSGFDERVAAELERSATRARARGGYAAAGAFLLRATQLTPNLSERAGRALEAAHAVYEAGASDTALDLLATADVGPLDDFQRARLALLRAQISFHLTRHPDVPQMLLAAAGDMAPFDADLAHETHLHALDAALVIGGPTTHDVASAALADASLERAVRPVDRLLVALSTTMIRGFAEGVPPLRDALQSLCDAAPVTAQGEQYRSWFWLAARSAVGILDDDLAHRLAEANVRSAREAGALTGLASALNFHANILALGGELTRAGEMAGQSIAILESTGGVPMRHAETIVSAWRGDAATVARLHELTLRNPGNPPDGAEVGLAAYAMAVLHNALGEYEKAQRAATITCACVALSLSSVGLAELIEAATRAGDPQSAAQALEELSDRADECDTSWARGVEARSRALTIVGPSAEPHYRAAIEHLEATRMTGEAARAHLLYGEWLRREGRRQQAREELRIAQDLLSRIGAHAFAARAANELRATGEHPRKRTTQSTDELTAQELQVARHVATGASSREVGAQLFLSPRTIEAHLRSIYRKLGITSRRELREIPLP
ncbi:AAA family ATPase [Isoptericola croceus]|uniref:AAA family ATPase n=1 Tax=Isoptericola croceus TaxID=3031406 RepID=UPI0023F90303|nr:helix-turn-helix transcriptional regulator [Isoptericola croceus]